MAKKKIKNPNDIAFNKKASFDYEMKEELIAGVQLQGWQVKAIRNKNVSLENNPHIVIDNKGEAWISGMLITPLKEANKNVKGFLEPNASIKLLLKKSEIARLKEQKEQKGFTIVLNKLFWKNNFVKAKISLAKGKNEADKRRTIKERDSKIESSRAMKKALTQ